MSQPLYADGTYVEVTTIMGGREYAIYKRPVPMFNNERHEVWVSNDPSKVRLVMTSNVHAIARKLSAGFACTNAGVMDSHGCAVIFTEDEALCQACADEAGVTLGI